MIEDVLKEIAKSAPATAAVIFIVCIFISFLKGEREARKEVVDACHATHSKLQEAATDAISDCNKAIRECAQKHGEVAEALRTIRGRGA